MTTATKIHFARAISFLVDADADIDVIITDADADADADVIILAARIFLLSPSFLFASKITVGHEWSIFL